VYLMQDNASPETAKNIMRELKELEMYDYVLPWPACSPDMNPTIQHVLRLMKFRNHRRSPRPLKRHELIVAIQE
ncbi:hypothetical protein EDC01DRAFT_624882, partial [Geopyxis carbonaria]